jgi:PLP dependent protein
MATIQGAILETRARIAEAARRAGRSAESVTLVAVSKTVGPERLLEAVSAGQLDFGENYAQELRDKAAAVPDVRWHFIGPLQRNKVKYVVGTTALIQTVDRLELAVEIDRQAAKVDGAQACLVQVNVGDEPQKAGCAVAALPQLLDGLRRLDRVAVQGLMCIPPAEGDPRPHFARLRQLAELHGLATLSMGMSADYEAAIAEGATLVRVGSAIFGARG